MKRFYSKPKANVYNIKNHLQFLTGSNTDNTGEGPAGTDPDVKEFTGTSSIWN